MRLPLYGQLLNRSLDLDLYGLRVLQHLGQIFQGSADLDQIGLELADVLG
jgi:hypothetical protein